MITQNVFACRATPSDCVALVFVRCFSKKMVALDAENNLSYGFMGVRVCGRKPAK